MEKKLVELFRAWDEKGNKLKLKGRVREKGGGYKIRPPRQFAEKNLLIKIGDRGQEYNCKSRLM